MYISNIIYIPPGGEMGWFRRIEPLEEEIEEEIIPETYISLTSGKKVVSNLGEMISDTK